MLILLSALVLVCPALYATQADPARLPTAARQLPNFDAYTVLNVPEQEAGFSYRDPVTGVTVVKLSSARVPTRNARVRNDYSEGGPYISGEWGDGMHTILLRVSERDTTGVWLVDYQRGSGVVSNWRRFPGNFQPELTASFSNRKGHEQLLYYVRDGELRSLDTASGKSEFIERFPDNNGRLEWLQSSRDDEWFVFVSGNRVYAYNRISRKTLFHDAPELDEPALGRDGRYVLLRDGGGNDASCPEGTFEEVWHLWDLTTDTMTCEGGSGFYSAHTGWTQGYFPNHNPNSATSEKFYYDPTTNTRTVVAQYADNNYFHATHQASQWIQESAGPGQWYFGNNEDSGDVDAVQWQRMDGDIYRSRIDWGARYQKPAIGVRAVYQRSSSSTDLFVHTLSSVTSVMEMSEGSFYYDTGSEELYVWARNGDNPAGRVWMAAPSPVHDGIGVARLDGSAIRLVAHHYSWPESYNQSVFATASPDGKLLMFNTTMGRQNPEARTDVFVIEIPVSGDPGR